MIPGRTVSESFRKRADSAAFWEAWVGAVLAREGLCTLHHPFVVDGGTYHDQSWDLDVSRGLINGNPALGSYQPAFGSSSAIPVECKSLSLEFKGAYDYPFNEVLVCSQDSWLKKWPGRDYTVRDFLFISTVTGAVVWLPAMSKVTLGHETYDSKRGELYKTVKTSVNNLRPLSAFVELVNDP